MKPNDFFSAAQKSQIVGAIEDAESNTSGEVRVHIDGICKSEVLDRAAYVFHKLKMHRTKQRNGVLFYLAVEDKKFAVIGDAGINSLVPSDFWDSIKSKMLEHFVKNQFTEGLEEGIRMAGQQLKVKFPHQTDDVNELSDEISFGK